MPSVTQVATHVRTRKTAEKRAVDYINLSDGNGAGIGEDFPYRHWDGQRHVACMLRYDVVKMPDRSYQVVSTRTMPVIYMEHIACGEVFEQGSAEYNAEVKADHHKQCGEEGRKWRHNLMEEEAF